MSTIYTSEYPLYIPEQDFIEETGERLIKNRSFKNIDTITFVTVCENKSFKDLKSFEEYILNAPEYYGRRYKYIGSIFYDFKKRLKEYENVKEIYSIDYSDIPSLVTHKVNDIRFELSFSTTVAITKKAEPFKEYIYEVVNVNDHDKIEPFKVSVIFNIGHDDNIEYDTFFLKAQDNFFSSEIKYFDGYEYNTSKEIIKKELKNSIEDKLEQYNDLIKKTEATLANAKESLVKLQNYLKDEQ